MADIAFGFSGLISQWLSGLRPNANNESLRALVRLQTGVQCFAARSSETVASAATGMEGEWFDIESAARPLHSKIKSIYGCCHFARKQQVVAAVQLGGLHAECILLLSNGMDQ